MSFIITNTAKNGTTIAAQATSDTAVTFTLTAITGGLGQASIPTGTEHNGTHYSATFTNVPAADSYRVTAQNGGRADTEPVPYPT